jgi:hypothetical protein
MLPYDAVQHPVLREEHEKQEPPYANIGVRARHHGRLAPFLRVLVHVVAIDGPGLGPSDLSRGWVLNWLARWSDLRP